VGREGDHFSTGAMANRSIERIIRARGARKTVLPFGKTKKKGTAQGHIHLALQRQLNPATGP